jgi:uncharacterized Rmd1/YagE family protein
MKQPISARFYNLTGQNNSYNIELVDMTKEKPLRNWGINTCDGFNLKLLYQFLITVYHVRRKRSKSDSKR